MVWTGRTNCQHLDNYRRCRVHTAPVWIRWLLPKGRPPCVYHAYGDEPQDGEVTCPDQMPYPRPDPPAPMPRKR